MISQKTYRKKNLHFLLAYFLLWVILFEFILPVNQILPKPSIVLMSFSALWKDYQLPVNLISSVSSIYLSLIIAYFLIYLLSKFILNEKHIVFDFISSLQWFSKYIPGIIFGMLLIYWLPDSPYTGFIFVMLTALSSFIIKLQDESKKVKQEYIEAAESLGAGKSVIAKKVIWKAVEPELFNHLLELHFYVWSLLLVFEYIKGGHGLGTIFRVALTYKDLSALFTTALITGIVIFAGTKLIKYFRNKYFHWSNY